MFISGLLPLLEYSCLPDCTGGRLCKYHSKYFIHDNDVMYVNRLYVVEN